MVQKNKYISQKQLNQMIAEIQKFNQVDSRINMGFVANNFLHISPGAFKNAYDGIYRIRIHHYEKWENEIKPIIEQKQQQYKNKTLIQIFNECQEYLSDKGNRERISQKLDIKPNTLRAFLYVSFEKITSGRILDIYDAIHNNAPYIKNKVRPNKGRSLAYDMISKEVSKLLNKGFTKKDIGIGLFKNKDIIYSYTNARRRIPKKKIYTIQEDYQKLADLNTIATRLKKEKAPLLIKEYGEKQIVEYAKENFNWTNIDTLIKDQDQKITSKRIFEICCFIELEKK